MTLVTTSLAVWLWSAAAQPVPAPDAGKLREEARQLEDKARDLKAGGHGDEAQELMGKVKELNAQAERLEQRRPEDAKQGIEERAALKKELEALRLELRRLKEEGPQEKAEDVRRRVAALEARLKPPVEREKAPAVPLKKRLAPPGPAEGPLAERRRAQARLRMEGPAPEPWRGVPPGERQEHLQQAIEHLRAAGFPQMAERLALEQRQLRQQPGGDIRRPLQALPPAEARELRQEVQRLRDALQELRRELQELRERR